MDPYPPIIQLTQASWLQSLSTKKTFYVYFLAC